MFVWNWWQVVYIGIKYISAHKENSYLTILVITFQTWNGCSAKYIDMYTKCMQCNLQIMHISCMSAAQKLVQLENCFIIEKLIGISRWGRMQTLTPMVMWPSHPLTRLLQLPQGMATVARHYLCLNWWHRNHSIQFSGGIDHLPSDYFSTTTFNNSTMPCRGKKM